MVFVGGAPCQLRTVIALSDMNAPPAGGAVSGHGAPEIVHSSRLTPMSHSQVAGASGRRRSGNHPTGGPSEKRTRSPTRQHWPLDCRGSSISPLPTSHEGRAAVHADASGEGAEGAEESAPGFMLTMSPTELSTLRSVTTTKIT